MKYFCGVHPWNDFEVGQECPVCRNTKEILASTRSLWITTADEIKMEAESVNEVSEATRVSEENTRLTRVVSLSPSSWAPLASLWAPKTEEAKMEAENTRLHDALKLRTDERDLALGKAKVANAWLNARTDERNAAVARADAAEQERDKARAACVWFERRIVELMTELARRPALVELDKKSGHNPFREIRMDRRLMGPGV